MPAGRRAARSPVGPPEHRGRGGGAAEKSRGGDTSNAPGTRSSGAPRARKVRSRAAPPDPGRESGFGARGAGERGTRSYFRSCPAARHAPSPLHPLKGAPRTRPGAQPERAPPASGCRGADPRVPGHRESPERSDPPDPSSPARAPHAGAQAQWRGGGVSEAGPAVGGARVGGASEAAVALGGRGSRRGACARLRVRSPARGASERALGPTGARVRGGRSAAAGRARSPGLGGAGPGGGRRCSTASRCGGATVMWRPSTGATARCSTCPTRSTATPAAWRSCCWTPTSSASCRR